MVLVGYKFQGTAINRMYGTPVGARLAGDGVLEIAIASKLGSYKKISVKPTTVANTSAQLNIKRRHSRGAWRISMKPSAISQALPTATSKIAIDSNHVAPA
jgi:hypothetical protein